MAGYRPVDLKKKNDAIYFSENMNQIYWNVYLL